MKKIVLFASGSGSNAENIIRYFQNTATAKVAAVFCNNPQAQVTHRSQALDVPVFIFSKDEFTGKVLEELVSIKPDLIVLAGFLLKFPSKLIATFPDKIVNIHPALLPGYGGKGMYGMHVHRSVLENRDAESGISIHYVNEHYDEGNIIFTKSVSISDCATPEEIAIKIQALEHKHYPEIIEKLLAVE